MTYKLIGDSCSDLTELQKNDSHFQTIPLVLQVGDYHVTDDENFDQLDFIKRVAACPTAPKSACPSPDAYATAYGCDAENVFVVTISEQLSGSYQSAVLAKSLYEEEHGAKNILVLSSHCAASGQLRLLLELEKLCKEDLPFEEICERITDFRNRMNTYFVLESLETLRKNGRLSGLSAFFATTLNIKPVMGVNEEGSIIKLDQARGIQKALKRMVEIAMKENGENTAEKTVVISQCNCPERGELVKKAFENAGTFQEVLVTESAGVTTMYAGDGGIVVSIG